MERNSFSAEPTPPNETPRRDFLTKAMAASLGAAAGLGPLAAGAYVALDPLRKTKSGEAPFIAVAPLDAVPADGAPRLFRIVGSLTDAWTRYDRAPIGAVYLRRTKEKPDEVLAIHPMCPHLGCFVNAIEGGRFHCPCHDSDFQAGGEIGNPKSPSPRGLDRLKTKVEDGKVHVQFLNFVPGIKDAKPIV